MSKLTVMLSKINHVVGRHKTISRKIRTSVSLSKDEEKKEEKDEKQQFVSLCPVNPLEMKALSDDCLCEGIKKPRVIILGAGIAGLSAANRLIEKGIKDIIIIEAKDRPGGRVHTKSMGSSFADLGASCIEGGCLANSVYNLARKEGLLDGEVKRKREIDDIFITSDGRELAGGKNMTKIMSQIVHEASSLFSRTKTPALGSLMEFFGARIKQAVNHLPEEERYDALRILYGLTNKLRARWGEDLSQMSAEYFGSYINIPGGRVLLPSGMSGLLTSLMKDIPSVAFKYKKLVQQVIYSTRPSSQCRALVKCCDGEEIPGDYVVVTFSLGVLKSQATQLFCPPLPVNKLCAISCLGYGHADRIYVQYEKSFWSGLHGALNPAWSEAELSERSDWVKGIASIEESGDNTLSLTVGGKEATAMEKYSDSRVIEDLTNFFRSLTGDPSLPCPKNIVRSNWSTDLAFLGSSSFMGLGSTVEHQCDLASPLPQLPDPSPPVVLFAGEATAPGHFSTLQGARLSGIREADRIVSLTMFYDGLPPSKMCNEL